MPDSRDPLGSDETSHASRGIRGVLTDAANDVGHRRIDTGAVLARSRRRRLPGQFAAGGIGVLAIAGIGFAGVQLAQSVAPSAVLSSGDAPGTEAGSQPGTDSSAGGSSFSGEAISLAPAEKINPCGGTVAELAPAASGLVASPVFPDRMPSGTETVPGSVTVTNTGTERVTGYTGASPAITVSQDGSTLWHSNGPQIALAQLIHLEPGASMRLPASITPVRCDAEDEAAESFRDDLPALEPGTYELSAIFYLLRDADAEAGAAPDVVSGPTQTITIE